MIPAVFVAGVVLAALQVQDPPSEDLKKRRAEVVPGTPVESGENLAVQKDAVEGLGLTRLGIAGSAVEGRPIWTPDGKTLFILETKGRIRRIETPSFKEERRVDLGIPATQLNRSREGLIVLVGDLQEVWVIDETRLTVKTRLHAPGLLYITSAPSLSYAYGSTGPELRILDLKRGGWITYAADVKWREWKDRIYKSPGMHELRSFNSPAASPDGRNLYWISGNWHWRASIGGPSIDAREAGPSCGRGDITYRAVFSFDSQQVVFAYRGGNSQVDEWPKIGNAGLYIFKTDNLNKPIGTIVDLGGSVDSLCFDKTSSIVYTRGRGYRLAIWTSGIKTHEFFRTTLGDGFIVAYPGGRRLLMRSDAEIYWVEIPENLASNVGKSDPAGPAAGKPASNPPVPPPDEGPPKGKPVTDPTSAKGKTLDVGGLVLTEISLGADPQARIYGSLWSGDGRSLYVTNGPGFLSKVSVPDLQEEKRVLIGGLASPPELSKEGILAVPRDASEMLWVIDPQTLEVKSKIPVKGVRGAVSSPTLSVALCSTQLGFPLVDLRRGVVIGELGTGTLWKASEPLYRHPDAEPLRMIANPRVSPDGRTVLCGDLHRFQLKDNAFTYVEAGAPVTVRWTEFSPDSRYVAVGVAAGGRAVMNHPVLKKDAVFIYKVNNLSEPIMILETPDAGSTGFGFDPVRKKLLLQDRGGALSILGTSGDREREFMPWQSGQNLGYSLKASPAGGTALVLNSRGVFLAQFPQ